MDVIIRNLTTFCCAYLGVGLLNAILIYTDPKFREALSDAVDDFRHSTRENGSPLWFINCMVFIVCGLNFIKCVFAWGYIFFKYF